MCRDLLSEAKHFDFTKKDRISYRSSSNGYQLKFFSKDKKYFVKAQASLSGVLVNDWMVEVIASDFCKALDIPCIAQKECTITYNDYNFCGVYSDNYELNGYQYISFESFINRGGYSTNEDAFYNLESIEKLKWCAGLISELGEIEYDTAERYMLDMAVIDCLVGNSDRHTRNFGVFYKDGHFKPAPVFDSGMGLFENNYDIDSFQDMDEAMRNTYIAPYGEDPFEFIKMLKKDFDLTVYSFHKLKMPKRLPNKFAAIYLEKMFREVQGV